MIELVPIIHVYKNRVVKTDRGNFKKLSSYAELPLEIATKLQDHGIKRINLVDLEGAQLGAVKNYETLEMIHRHTDLLIDFSGGVISDGNIRLAFESGASTVTSASIAVNQPELFYSWLITYGPSKLVMAADAKNGKIHTGGWQKATEIDLFDHIEHYISRGLQFVKCTEISVDGQLEGPPFQLYKDIIQKFEGIKLLSNGGVRHLGDIKALENIGVHGAMFASALYEGKITYKDIEKYLTAGN